MTATRLFRCATLLVLAVALVSGCARKHAEKRVLVFSGSETPLPDVLAALREVGEAEEIVFDTAQSPTRFVEDSLARYSAVVFLNTSGDALNHRQQADFERYVQAGGGFVGLGVEPSKTWPWFNRLLESGGDGSLVELQQEFDGGRAYLAAVREESGAAGGSVSRERLRAALDFAIGKNRIPDYSRARTPRVPEANRFQQETLLLGTLDEPTELEVTSDGRVFFTERKGALKLYDPAQGSARVIARLDVNHVSENGLIGLALDPSFDDTGWLYLTYSVADTLKHRVSRFTFTGDGIAEEKVLLEVPFTEGCCHTGGSMTFGPEGNLFVSFGDNTNPFDAGSYAPIDPSPGRELMDARRSSANTQDLRGKILRIRPQPDGSYTIPEGNLFADPSQGRPEIYTMGHRNPYRISVDPHTGYLYWGEVGPDAGNDSIFGPQGYDEVNQARQAGNFGWPMFIADNKAYLDYNFTSGWKGDYFDPERPINDSPNNTGAKVLPPAQPAMIYYPYTPSEQFPLVGEGGRNAMAGPVYHFDDYPGSTEKLPRYYDGKFIHYDWIRGWMMAATLDEQGDYVKMEPFLDHLTFDHPIDVELGPDGSLYVLEYGTYWFAQNPTSRLSRVSFHAGNRPPKARLSASPAVGAAPLEVELSAEESIDHDEEDELRYQWTLPDGATVEGSSLTRTFDEPGRYVVRLTVRDAEGATDEVSTEVLVGNAPPKVDVALQGNRSFFWEHGPLEYRVQVEDAEDGTLENGIDPQRVRVAFDYLPEGAGQVVSEPGHQADRTPKGRTLMDGSDCMACHAVDQASVGPSFRRVAERYAGREDALPYLVSKVIQGGGGVWGEHSMAAHPNLAKQAVEEMVRYILSLASEGATLPVAGAVRLDQHEAEEGGAYILSVAYTDEARNGIGPLRKAAEVVLRRPVVRAADVSGAYRFGAAVGLAADGEERPLATAYDSGAHLPLGRTDLTGVGAIRLSVQSLGHPFAVELRSGSPEGKLLASQAVAARKRDSWFQLDVPVQVSGERELYVVLRSEVEGLGQWNPLLRLDEIRFRRSM